jgi:diguanylate cyclase (GGDEF)-like protein/PAS domain S-box-containing protein
MNADEDDVKVIQKLYAQIERLERVESQLQALEDERNSLKSHTDSLSSEIKSLRKAKEDWEWFFENSLDLLCIANLEGYFQRVNPAFVKTLGFSKAELESRPFFDFIHPDDIDSTRQELIGLGDGRPCINFENRYRDSAGNWHWLSWRCPALTPTTTRLYAIARDVTESKRTEAEILHQATHDSLTGLLNRAAFEHELDHAIERVKRDPDIHLALLIIDLDDFKPINDNFGHQAGDHLLIEVARHFRSNMRKNDVVGRLGGDEFAWLTEGRQDQRPDILVQRLLQALKSPIALNANRLSIGCSIGIASFPTDAKDAKDLFSKADEAMYKVKKTGKGGFAFY